MNRQPFVRFATLIAGLSLALAAHHARAAAPWWQETTAPERAAAAQVLGDLASWSIQNARLQPGEYTTAMIGNHPVIAPDKLGLRLTSHTRYPAGTELVVRYRYAPAPNATASFKLSAAVKDPADAKEKNIWFSSSVRGGADQIACHAWDPVLDQAGERRTFVTEYYRLNGIGDRSLGWPERLRQIAEHQSALLPSLEEAWITVRVRLVERGFAVWVNDRLLLERHDLDLDTSGQVRLELSAGTELAAFTARPAPAADPLFEPIPLDGYLNAHEFNRSAIDHGSLPPPDRSVLVAGVSFVFPAADAHGNDHLDLGTSWLQSGNLQGHLDPARGPFGGRWPSPFWLNPARIQLQIPNRRYRAIHLIAAADGDSLSVPVVTVQFYRPRSGAPVNTSTSVPLFTARSTEVTPLPVRLANGRAGNLYRITIPINPGDLALFDDLDTVAVELTKEVQLYRAYPDP
ncbi:hypothetical protein HQ590_10885, partial [bacterium]|nr:hypothetical protein [bacterium]